MNTRFVQAILAASLVALTSCSSDGENSTEDSQTEDTTFECAEDRSGWEQCVDGMVEYCHIVEGIDPHFHWGADCQSLGFDCVELTETTAACLDTSSTCTVGDTKCEENTAYTCVDHDGDGHWAVDPCGTAATCEVTDGEAQCLQVETEFDPQSACDAMTDVAEEKAVVTTFDDVFTEDSHADLGVRVHVTLPDDQPSYIHFPVYSCGEFAVFLDQTGIFDGIQHRDGTELLTSGGVGVDLCTDAIPEHWHADLEWDGDGTEGTDPVPYVIRFAAVPGGGEVDFVVFQIAAED